MKYKKRVLFEKSFKLEYRTKIKTNHFDREFYYAISEIDSHLDFVCMYFVEEILKKEIIKMELIIEHNSDEYLRLYYKIVDDCNKMLPKYQDIGSVNFCMYYFVSIITNGIYSSREIFNQ